MPRKSSNISTAGSRKNARIQTANATAVAVQSAPASASFTGGKRKATPGSQPPAKKAKGESSTKSRKIAIPKKPIAKAKAAVPAKKKPKGRGRPSQAKVPKKAVASIAHKRKAEEDDEDDAAPASKKSKTLRKIAPVKKPRKVAAPKPPKPVKQLPEINTAPTQVLNVYVFGEGTSGELGFGTGTRREVMDAKRPRLNRRLGADDVGVVQVAVGGMHAAALTRDNKIITWGCNDAGALGRETTRQQQQQDDEDEDDEDCGLNPLEAEPREVDSAHFPPGTKFTQLECTDGTTFAVTATGLVYGWGQFRASDGPIGFRRFTPKDQPKYQATPMLIPELKNITSLTSGTNHIVALDAEGNAWAWGAADAYQLGRPDRASRTEHTCLHPMRVPGLEGKKIVSVGCGDMHTIAVDDTGIAYGWGLNAAGECSIHPIVKDVSWIVEQPKVIQGLGAHHIKQVVGGTHHTLALALDGKVLVWGAVESNQSGLDLATLPAGSCHFNDADGLTTAGIPKYKYLMQPTIIPGLTASHISAGVDTSAVITTDGKVHTWGYNGTYSAGQGPNSPAPGGSDAITLPTLIDNTAVRGKQLVFAGIGGQFGVVCGIPEVAAPEQPAAAEIVAQQAVVEPATPKPAVAENPEANVVAQVGVPEERAAEEKVVEKAAVEVVEETVVEQAIVGQPVAAQQTLAVEQTVAEDTVMEETFLEDTLPMKAAVVEPVAEDRMEE